MFLSKDYLHVKYITYTISLVKQYFTKCRYYYLFNIIRHRNCSVCSHIEASLVKSRSMGGWYYHDVPIIEWKCIFTIAYL